MNPTKRIRTLRHAVLLRSPLSASKKPQRDLLVRAMFFQQVRPLVIVHLHGIGQWPVLALVLGVHVRTAVDKNLDHAAVLQVQGGVENRVAVGVGSIHVGAFVDEELRIIRLIAKHGKKQWRGTA